MSIYNLIKLLNIELSKLLSKKYKEKRYKIKFSKLRKIKEGRATD